MLCLLSEDLGRMECRGPFAVAITNVSRRAPGRRCLAIAVAAHVTQVVDEVGRTGATLKHAVVSCERRLDAQSVLLAAQSLLAALTAGSSARTASPDGQECYRNYLAAQQDGRSQAQAVADYLIPYVQGVDLGSSPAAETTELPALFQVPARRVYFVTYPRSCEMKSILESAARVAIALHYAGYRPSTIEGLTWSSVEFGTSHPIDPRDGLTVRFVCEEELPSDAGEPLPIRSLPSWKSEEQFRADLFALLLPRERNGSTEQTGGRHRDAPLVQMAEARSGVAPRDTHSHSAVDRSQRIRTLAVRGEESTAPPSSHLTAPMRPIALGEAVAPHPSSLPSNIFSSQPISQPTPARTWHQHPAVVALTVAWATIVWSASIVVLWAAITHVWPSVFSVRPAKGTVSCGEVQPAPALAASPALAAAMITKLVPVQTPSRDTQPERPHPENKPSQVVAPAPIPRSEAARAEHGTHKKESKREHSPSAGASPSREPSRWVPINTNPVAPFDPLSPPRSAPETGEPPSTPLPYQLGLSSPTP